MSRVKNTDVNKKLSYQLTPESPSPDMSWRQSKSPSSKVKPLVNALDHKKKNISGIILPKNKPLVFAKKKVESKDKKLKSKYYNKKDLEIAKKAISLMEKRKWEPAIKLSKKAKDKSIYNFCLLYTSDAADD